MRKLILLFSIFLISTQGYSQITATGTYKSYQNTYTGIDYLIVFNGINSNTSLKYNGTYQNINWYKFSDPNTSISNQNENFNVENGTGYILDVDGVKTTIWVIDYQDYLPVFTSLVPEDSPSTQCSNLTLNINANVPLIKYSTSDGYQYTIDRKFTLSYNSKSWSGTAWSDVVKTQEITLPQSSYELFDVPLCDTRFKIEGDQFATDLGISPLPSIESDLYSAVAVQCHITTTAATRTDLQEGDRPSTKTVQSGSAPLDIMFESNANVPVALYYKWQIYKDNELLFDRTDQDQRYTFTEAGDYTVKCTTSNNFCSYTDSVTISVSTSALQVPYVFTPNGDGINDEFRVAYKSIISFKCWVFNRWGRTVFTWTDPQKGWDGTFNGVPAKPGAYFYVIDAVGADGKKYNLRGTINLLRGSSK